MIGSARMMLVSGAETGSGPTNTEYYDYAITLLPDYYYRLGDAIGSSIAVEEIASVNGTYTGTPVLGQPSLLVSDSDKSVNFNQVGWVDVPSVTDLVDNTKPFSIIFSTKANNNNNDGYFLLPGTVGNAGLLVWQGTAGYGDIAIGSGVAADWTKVHTLYSPVVGQIYHLAIVYDGVSPTSASSFKFYVDGSISATAVSGGYGIYATDNLEIGNMSSIAGRILPAYMDEVLLFKDKEVSRTEIANLYYKSKNLPVNTEYYAYAISLLPDYYYRLGEASGSTIAVEEISGANGTYTGTPILDQDSLIDLCLDSSVDFNGAGWVDIPTVTEVIDNTKPFSIVFSTKANVNGTGSYLMLPGVGSQDGVILWQGQAGYGDLHIGNSSSDWGKVYTVYSPIVDQVYHIAVVYDGVAPLLSTSFKFYVDGVLKTSTSSGNIVYQPCTNLEIANRSQVVGKILPGFMDELLIFKDKALTSTEILNLYNKSL